MFRRQFTRFNKRCIHVGESHTITRVFSAEDIQLYAKLTGDTNPIHLDPQVARATGFRRQVVHGMLVVGLFSQLLGQHLPGPQSIYTQQSIKFTHPVLVDDMIVAAVEVLDYDPAKCDVWLRTTVRREIDGKLCVTGTAIGRNKHIDFSPRDVSLGEVPRVGPASAAEAAMPRGLPSTPRS